MPCRNQTGMEEANTDCDHPQPRPPPSHPIIKKKKQKVRSENCKGSPTPSIQYISRPNIMRWRKISNLSLSLSLFDFGVYGCNNNKYAGRWKQGWKKRSKTKQTNPGKKKKTKTTRTHKAKNQNKTKTERTNKLYYIYIHETKQEKKAKKKKKKQKMLLCLELFFLSYKVRSEFRFSFRVFHANHLLRPVITICWRLLTLCVFVCFFFFNFLWFSDLFSVYG